MRTTLTLDEDVAVMLEKLRKRTGGRLKDLVNHALREGLQAMEAPRKRKVRFRVRPLRVGRCALSSLDDVAEVLAVAEGEGYR